MEFCKYLFVWLQVYGLYTKGKTIRYPSKVVQESEELKNSHPMTYSFQTNLPFSYYALFFL